MSRRPQALRYRPPNSRRVDASAHGNGKGDADHPSINSLVDEESQFFCQFIKIVSVRVSVGGAHISWPINGGFPDGGNRETRPAWTLDPRNDCQRRESR